jgi:hypothetical protein
MTKKDYQKPTMKVVQLQYHSQILAGSPNTLSGSKGEDSTPDTWYELE